MTDFFSATIGGTVVQIPKTPALSLEAIQQAVVWQSTGVIVAYDAANQMGAVLLPGAPVWQCWTPVDKESFLDMVNECVLAARNQNRLAS